MNLCSIVLSFVLSSEFSLELSPSSFWECCTIFQHHISKIDDVPHGNDNSILLHGNFHSNTVFSFLSNFILLNTVVATFHNEK